MRTRPRSTVVALTILGLVLLLERPTEAYIDPGSGSLVYQAILAAILGLGFTFRRVLGAIARLGRGSTSPGRPGDAQPERRDERV